MRNSRFSFVCGAVLLAAGLSACNAEIPQNCAKPVGVFKPEYSFISGTCQTDYTPFHLKFEEDNPNFTMVIETRFADTIVTETLLKGCELNLKQTLTSSNGNTTRMALAGSLYVDNAEQLHGTVERVDFMDDGATERCRTTYEALYTVNGLLLGAAARGD